MAVPVIALGIPASLTVENTTPYIIIATAPGIKVYKLAAVGLISEGRINTAAKRTDKIRNAVQSHLHVDLKSLSAISPPTGAKSKRR